ncbi:MAG: DEAD/DEAH box helicase [Desulfobacterales bacterium]|nr:DEAD/DEAH box helicase [Desulfobacterales bacterium]
MKFNDFNFHPQVRAGVTTAGYQTPTPIQTQAIPRVMQGNDVMGLAQTGTGKTAAFVLPMLHRLLAGRRGPVRGLIIAPTRELAEQINEAIIELGKETGIRSLTIYGGVNANPQVAKLKQGVDIVVACPGRLLDHLNQGNIDLSHLETLVLDEADHMFDMGFLPDIRRIIRYVPKKRQTLLFSATMPDEIRGLAHEVLHDPATIQVDTVAPARTVSHALYPVEPHLKTAMLLELLKLTQTESVLVFTRTKYRAKRLGEKLAKSGFRAASLQGNLSQNRRQAALNGFRDGSFQILVATDIAARGIDVSLISHVINYDIPNTTDAYIHRIGRTGRAAKSGEAYTLVSGEDQTMIRAIERALGSPLERRTVAGFDYRVTPPRKNTEFARPPRQPRPRRKPARQSKTKPGQGKQQGARPVSSTRTGGPGQKSPGGSGARPGRGSAPLGLDLRTGQGGGQRRGGR